VVLAVELTMEPLVQPVATITAADSNRNASLKCLSFVLKDISNTSLSAGTATYEERTLSGQGHLPLIQTGRFRSRGRVSKHTLERMEANLNGLNWISAERRKKSGRCALVCGAIAGNCLRRQASPLRVVTGRRSDRHRTMRGVAHRRKIFRDARIQLLGYESWGRGKARRLLNGNQPAGEHA
jgi:hypothetical protein